MRKYLLAHTTALFWAQTRKPKMEFGLNTTSFPSKLFVIMVLFTGSGFGLIGNDKEAPGRKLFVFGDSYSDTGNWKKGTGIAWNLPYGSTFLGKPAGRFSDGRILTDFMASNFGIESPVPYEQRKWHGVARRLKFGINLAYGGTGVFDADVSGPNMTTQIDSFQNLLETERSYTQHDLESSIALVTLGGNDYKHFLKHGSLEDIANFTRSVVRQLELNLNCIHHLGVAKIAVTGLEPLGCWPLFSSSSSYVSCNEKMNAVARFHNRVLKHAIRELNKQSPAFLFLDLYGAFLSGLKRPKQQNGKVEYENPFKPCCEGVTKNYKCGSTEGTETKYKVCPNPEAAFFWDAVHPTQNGWHQIFLFIRSSLNAFC